MTETDPATLAELRDKVLAREDCRKSLNRLSKTQLTRTVNESLIGSAYPPSKWRKDELITFILDREFPGAML